MKILSKDADSLSHIEKYDLNEAFSECPSNKGLILCYALASNSKVRILSLELEAEHEEVSAPEKWNKKDTGSFFSAAFASLEDFLAAFDKDEFGRWTLKAIYQDTEFIANGKRTETEIGVSYPKEKTVNMLPLLYDVENSTYEYNECDEEILNMLKKEFRMTTKRAVLTIQKLQLHRDIFDEFVLVLTSERDIGEANAIAVEGFTAERLHNDYPLSLLGAYNYLIYLRESPEEALADLKKGLPSK